MEPERKYLYPKSLLALIPGLYAWQLYGWPSGVAVFLAANLSLLALGYARIFWDWSFRRLVMVRILLIVLLTAGVGLSAAQTCDHAGNCRGVWASTAN
jgi:hypothetical protein